MKTKLTPHEEVVEGVITTAGEWAASFDFQAFQDFYSDSDTDIMVKIHNEVGAMIIKRSAQIVKLLYPNGIPNKLRNKIDKMEKCRL